MLTFFFDGLLTYLRHGSSGACVQCGFHYHHLKWNYHFRHFVVLYSALFFVLRRYHSECPIAVASWVLYRISVKYLNLLELQTIMQACTLWLRSVLVFTTYSSSWRSFYCTLTLAADISLVLLRTSAVCSVFYFVREGWEMYTFGTAAFGYHERSIYSEDFTSYVLSLKAEGSVVNFVTHEKFVWPNVSTIVTFPPPVQKGMFCI